MTAGRPPKPTALKLLTGNPGKRPIRFDEFKPESAIPECPESLTGEARTEWDRITAELHRYGMIAHVDRGLLAMLCNAWARWVEAEAMIAKAAAASGSGLFVKTPNGFPVQSPWLAASNKAIETYQRLCAEFGLSPASRTRVVPHTTQPDLPGLEVVGGTEHANLGDMLK